MLTHFEFANINILLSTALFSQHKIFTGLRCKKLCSPFSFQFIVLEAFIHFIRYIVIQRLMKPSLCCRRMNLAIQILAIWKMKGYNKSADMVVENEIIIKQRRKNKTYFFDYRKFFSRPEQNLQSFLTSDAYSFPKRKSAKFIMLIPSYKYFSCLVRAIKTFG